MWVYADIGKQIKLNEETTISIQEFGQAGGDLLLWLPSESGQLEQEESQAEKLAAMGYQVWLADVLTAWFLPALPSSLEKLPADELVELVEQARQQSNQKVYLVSSGRGALLSLRVAKAWQQRYGEKATLGGVIMLSPKLFTHTPDPGEDAQFMPVVQQSNLPLFIIQPANSPWRWKLDRTIPALETGGSDVFTWMLADTRDRFYYRPDATTEEDKMTERLASLIAEATKLLKSYNNHTRKVTVEKTEKVVIRKKQERSLRPYKGDPKPPALVLDNLDGKIVDLKDYRGKVVLVNFWASWCPPCVHEMPSMQALSEQFKDQPFEILAVNMAEDNVTVKIFLQEKVAVKFPILMDTDGQALKRWGVFAFPTSYIIDKEGKMSLALFGAIDWMEPVVKKQIEMLVKK
jgi:thiol-disulfide isomerase/thioredoxin